MSEQNKAIVRRLMEGSFNAGNLAVIDELCAASYVSHEPGQEIRGPEEFRQQVTMYRTAFPDDLQITIEDQIAEGDMVVTRWTGSGTHKGQLMDIPPTGNQVTITGIDISHIESGKLVELRPAGHDATARGYSCAGAGGVAVLESGADAS